MKALAIVVLGFCAAVAHGETVPFPLCEAVSGSSVDGYNQKLARLICEGESDYSRGDYSGAEVKFRDALNVVLEDAPNYWPLLNLAATLCAQGKCADARKILIELDCALAVESGEAKCYLDDKQVVRNSSIGQMCFKRMCADAYLPQWLAGTRKGIEMRAAIRAAANQLRQICGSRRAPP